MVEVSSGWPMPNATVWLQNPMSRKYSADYPDLEYAFLGDPRNWLVHYLDIQIGAMVAAKC